MLFYIKCVGAKGPFLVDGGEADTLDSNEWHVWTSKNFAASLVEVKNFIDDHSSFVSEILASMDDVDVKDVVKSVATLFINAINESNEIVAARDPDDRGANSEDFILPSVAPENLVLLRTSEFSAFVRSHEERLLAHWTLEEIDLITTSC
ncbi:hypothetical protein KXD40_002295 [Peronospora effusa]|uniref:Uncharacterized protein n=1 Tax=Peronospora effusa TaxID=542832 RepID=A0A3M6VH44_9STRA|nr:hypothetical protein DD238_003962 [Peronospora effusa]UIZ26526.1 hypothetical protein KXD40_002295 [Peronospora effusa]CAI5726705.1 unnamed protein product [Peronospora effusa]